MATVQELRAQIAQLEAEQRPLEDQAKTIANRRLEIRRRLNEIERFQGSVRDPLEAQATVPEFNRLREEDRVLAEQQARIDARIVELQQQINRDQQLINSSQQAATQARARDDAGTPTVASGAVVANAQTARDQGANTVLPGETPLPPLTPSNASPTPVGSGEDPGTNGRVRSAAETQSTNLQQLPQQGRLVADVAGRDTANAAPVSAAGAAVNNNRSGTAASSDDRSTDSSPTQQTNQTRSRLDALYGGSTPPITAETNILSNFASYTYSLSWYLVDPTAYRELVTQQKRNLKGFYLLVQSAGIGQNVGQSVSDNQQLGVNQQNPQVTAASAGRNQFFPLDYYIDNLETEVMFPAGGGSQSAAAFKNISFTLTEPNGITLLPNLYRACEDLIKQGGELYATNDRINYAAAMFCMVVRFYGYDDNGMLVQPITNRPGSTDRDAVVEKFIPFVLKKIDFSVGARMVEYTIEGGTPEVRTGLATDRGSIPQNFDFSGVTVQDILVGATVLNTSNVSDDTNGRPSTVEPNTTSRSLGRTPPVTGGGRASTSRSLGRTPPGTANARVTPSAPPTADSAPKPVSNNVATGLVAALTNFQQRLLQEGKIEQVDIYEIKFADSILSDATITPPGGLNKNRVGGTATASAADQKLPDKNSIAPTVRSRSVTAGTQIVQFIDEVVRNSSYIVDQQAVIYDEKTKQYQQNGKPAQQFAWFQITVKSEPLSYDRKRNDYAYRMIYYVTPYETPMVSEYFSPSGFRGVHKIYNWLFTGENTEVLQFEQSFDKLWTQALTADTNILELVQQQKQQMNSREQWMRHYYPASGQNRQGGEGKVFEAGANAADFLYGPNYGSIQLNIIGDPAWVPNAFYEYNTDNFTPTPFWPDGTINSQASIPYFELAWNRPVDYNLDTGLMDPGQRNYFADREKGQAGLAAESQTYIAVRCKSQFKGGRFSQELEGAWMWDQTINEPKDERQVQDTPDLRAGRGTNRVEGANVLPVRVAGDGSSTARGVQQLLNPPTQSVNPTLAQIQSSQAYITARRAGVSAREAEELARQAFVAGAAGEPYNTQRIVREP